MESGNPPQGLLSAHTKGGKIMPVMDEFKEERAALKNGTLKEKLSYFWCYYKWHVVAAVAIVAFAVSMTVSILTSKENALYVAIINAVELPPAAEYPAAFAEYAGIDTQTYDILFDTTMRFGDSMDQDTIASSQKLMTYLAAGELDVFVGDEAAINQYAYNETFYDLRDVLTAEQLEQYEPYFYYLDQTLLDALNEAKDSPDYDYTSFTHRPDPKDPEAMENPVPVGLYLNTAASFLENYYFSGDVVLAIPVNCGSMENASKFIDFVLE